MAQQCLHFRTAVAGRAPRPVEVADFMDACRAFLFPGFFHHIDALPSGIVRKLTPLIDDACTVITSHELDSRHVASLFAEKLPAITGLLARDVEATYLGDPAAESTDEVVICYPGIHAITNHRVAHALHELHIPLLPRMIAEMAHSHTGIDIHPAASIGPAFTIDHGTGVVIGATSIIGSNVKLYQGVTLGARSFDLDKEGNPIKGMPRHPIVGNDVVIYSNTTILGRITIGDGAVIGGNLWITGDVAPGEKLVQAKPNNILRFQQ